MTSQKWFVGAGIAVVFMTWLARDASGDPIHIVPVRSPTQFSGLLTVEDFEDDALTSGVRFAAPSGGERFPASSASGGVTSSGEFGLLPTRDAFILGPINIAFVKPVFSAGMFFGNDDLCCSTGFTAFLDAFAGSTLVGTVGVRANMNDFVDQFIGFNSNTPISNVRIRYGSTNDVGLFTFIDDVTFSHVAATPEPSTLLLMMSAAVIMVSRRYRRACRGSTRWS
jgi:hypothetical protein